MTIVLEREYTFRLAQGGSKNDNLGVKELLVFLCPPISEGPFEWLGATLVTREPIIEVSIEVCST